MTLTKSPAEATKQRYREVRTRFAMVDPALFGVALFKPLPRQNRSNARLNSFEIETIFGGRKLRIVSAYRLAADDLSVLLGICGMCGLDGLTVEASKSQAHRIAIVDGLESEGDVVQANHVRLRTTIYAVVREAGLTDTGSAYLRVTSSLARMSAVQYTDLGQANSSTQTLRTGGKQQLLSAIADEKSGELRIVLNARFTQAIFGSQFIKINLDESRSLGEPARLLHSRLSVGIRESKSMTIGIDKLAGWLFGASAELSQQQKLDQRKYIRNALADLVALPNWEVDTAQRAIVTIRRLFRDPSSEKPVVLPLKARRVAPVTPSYCS